MLNTWICQVEGSLKSNWGASWIRPYNYEIRSVDIFINTNESNELLRRPLLKKS